MALGDLAQTGVTALDVAKRSGRQNELLRGVARAEAGGQPASRAAPAGTAASISAVAGFSSEARRRSAAAERTPAAGVPTRTTSSHGKDRQRRSHARLPPSGPA
ncbi:hypothetical protein [Kitasatospora sp. McL0602]|uniref:hypothetical protein n=1 Tax=Kitasatospora sp. McL0602 TaxID=3439530 RepID=UPI003F8AD406